MLLNDIIKWVAPITATVEDYVAMTFPVPTNKGIIVLYYVTSAHENPACRSFNLIKGVLIPQASSVQTFEPHEAQNYGLSVEVTISKATKGFPEVNSQRSLCAQLLERIFPADRADEYLHLSASLEQENLALFVKETEMLGEYIGLQQIYHDLLSDMRAYLK